VRVATLPYKTRCEGQVVAEVEEQPTSKLFMLLLGGRPVGRNTEQHDVFFGIAADLPGLLPQLAAFWPGVQLHIDAWRMVTSVDEFTVSVAQRTPMAAGAAAVAPVRRLFFINLGGYQASRFEEQHHYVLTAQQDKPSAIRHVKQTDFYRKNHMPGGASHVDDKYGIDVDDILEIDELLPTQLKERYRVILTAERPQPPDAIHLGYTKLSSLKSSLP